MTNMNPYMGERIMNEAARRRERALRDYETAGYPRHAVTSDHDSQGRGVRLLRLGDWRIDLTLRKF